MTLAATHRTSPVLFIPHGGGPLPLLGDPGHKVLVDFLTRVPRMFPNPGAVLLISAHWEEEIPTVTGGVHPSLIYDYYGFPEESYRISYPAPGDPELAEGIVRTLGAHGIQARSDPQRGFDHGMFVPMKLMYPDATIPVVQLSLVRGLDPALHIAIGHALAPLRDRDILIIGSGFSFHNLRAFFSGQPDGRDPENEAFQSWIVDTLTSQTLSPEARVAALIGWERVPAARYCHPREEHLLPLHLCAAAGAGPARVVFDDVILGKRAVGLLWQ